MFGGGSSLLGFTTFSRLALEESRTQLYDTQWLRVVPSDITLGISVCVSACVSEHECECVCECACVSERECECVCACVSEHECVCVHV